MAQPRRTVEVAALAVVPAAASGAKVSIRAGMVGVRAGHARFEVLTPTLIRLEYSPNDRFEDRRTVVAQDRKMRSWAKKPKKSAPAASAAACSQE